VCRVQKAHARSIAAADFLNVEVRSLRGLRTFLVLIAIRHDSRKVEILGVTIKVGDDFSRNAARNFVDPTARAMNVGTHLIIDRAAKVTRAFKMGVESAGVKIVRTPAPSPNCTAIAERFVGSLRREVVGRMIFLGELHLRRVLNEFVAHYHGERPHRGMGNPILEPGPEVRKSAGEIRRCDQLGCILDYHHRAAA
jgi:transposase InsO family protein